MECISAFMSTCNYDLLTMTFKYDNILEKTIHQTIMKQDDWDISYDSNYFVVYLKKEKIPYNYGKLRTIRKEDINE